MSCYLIHIFIFYFVCFILICIGAGFDPPVSCSCCILSIHTTSQYVLIDFQAAVLKVGFGRTSHRFIAPRFFACLKSASAASSSSLHSTAIIPRDCLGLPFIRSLVTGLVLCVFYDTIELIRYM
jgi:hypothetical protein